MIGKLLYRPWFDAVGVPFVARVYLPLSRAWAAARAAGTDLERFREETKTDLGGAAVRAALWRVRVSTRVYDGALTHWDRTLFRAKASSPTRLAAAHALRQAAATNWLLARTAFLPWVRRFLPARWEIPSPAEVETAHGARLAAPEDAYPLPPQPEIQRSQVMRRGGRSTFWLRFRSPHLGDQAWARVSEPAAIPNPPTLIHLHGIAAEPDLWPDRRDAWSWFVDKGVRVIRATAPWHGRRMPETLYSGEPVLARGPEGLLTLFQAWLAEVAILLRWARAQEGAPVAVAGVSLGALAAQRFATAAHRWPEPLRPDALLLVATTGFITDIVIGGSLARRTDLATELERAAWGTDELQRWRPLLEPDGAPALPSERIVMVLGEADDLTPVAGGLMLAHAWNVPEENLFVRPQGHFSLALGLTGDRAPLRRFRSLIRAKD